MDRPIIEVLNTIGLLIFSLGLLVSFTLISNFSQSLIYDTYISSIEVEIKNILNKIYLNVKNYNASEEIILYTKHLITLESKNYSLIIKLKNFSKMVTSFLKLKGHGTSYYFKFSYFNGTIEILPLNFFKYSA